MPRCCLWVEFELKPGAWAAFNAIMREHRDKTLAEEGGCRQFDILHPELTGGHIDESRVMLYEVYDDHAALATHNAGPRMPQVGAALAPLKSRQTVALFALD